MKYMSSRDIRSRFLEFFEERGHERVPSSSLVPANDPTLIFTSAGMVQFKDIFLGNETRPYKRAATSQKCMRAGGKHNDLENVGPSIRHQTFFEMLGNFSFGDYFKREAIAFAWELLTKDFGLDPNRLWPTIYLDDDESYELWQEVAGVPAHRITRLGAEDNFWSMGDRGPCGPNTEIYWDFNPERGEEENPGTNEDRFFEIWNLVFMQFDQPGDGSLVPLEHPGVDTGMGLERMSVVMQGVHDTYDTDLFKPIMERTRELTGHSNDEMERNKSSYRVIADHGRAATFLLGDGVTPSNEWRGYVLRRVMRRAMVHGRRLGLDKPFLSEISNAVMEIMGDVYPELIQRRDFILDGIVKEEQAFSRTLIAGLNRFDQVASTLSLQAGDTFPGDEMFKLYDTFGLSKELVIDLAVARGFEIDLDGYTTAMDRQRKQSKESTILKAGERENLDVYQQISPEPSRFLGYDYSMLDTTGSVLGIVAGKERVDEAGKGQHVEVILDQTPFYPEGGGQIGDRGALHWESGLMEVRDTRRPVAGIIVHRGVVKEGTLRVGTEVRAEVPGEVRWDTMRNHTATHLLHKALRDTLGTHVHQKGSVVEPNRLRFDFNHGQALSREEIIEIERIVNEQIRDDYPVQAVQTTLQEAMSQGAMALFEEKYGDSVRMIHIPGYESRELCGGTHVQRTGQIGAFFITTEGSIGSGIRRVEAVTGPVAIEYAQERRESLSSVASALQTTPDNALAQVAALREQLREAGRRIENLERQIARGETGQMAQHVQQVDGVAVLTSRVSTATNIDTLRQTGDHLRDKLGSGVVVLGAIIEGQPKLLAMVTKDVVERGLNARNIINEIAPSIGGQGGGPPHMAQAGGKDPEGLDKALGMVPRVVAQALGVEQ
jgi:alanyl-tRNA synthetase